MGRWGAQTKKQKQSGEHDFSNEKWMFPPPPFERGWASFFSLRSKGISGITRKGLDAEKSHFPVHSAATLFFSSCRPEWRRMQKLAFLCWHLAAGTASVHTNTGLKQISCECDGPKQKSRRNLCRRFGDQPTTPWPFVGLATHGETKTWCGKKDGFWMPRILHPGCVPNSATLVAIPPVAGLGLCFWNPFLPQLPIKVWLAQKTFILWELFCF